MIEDILQAYVKALMKRRYPAAFPLFMSLDSAEDCVLKVNAPLPLAPNTTSQSQKCG